MGGEKLWEYPTLGEVENFSRSIKTTLTPESSVKDFKKKFTKKRLTTEHKTLIDKAKSEIDRLGYVMLDSAKNIRLIKKKKERWKEVAVPFPDANKFSFVKSAYLKDPALYDDLAKYSKKEIGQFRRTLFGWLMNRIFEEHGLEKMRAENIIKYVRQINKELSST